MCRSCGVISASEPPFPLVGDDNIFNKLLSLNELSINNDLLLAHLLAIKPSESKKPTVDFASFDAQKLTQTLKGLRIKTTTSTKRLERYVPLSPNNQFNVPGDQTTTEESRSVEMLPVAAGATVGTSAGADAKTVLEAKTSGATGGPRQSLWLKMAELDRLNRDQLVAIISSHGKKVRELQLLLPAFAQNCTDLLTTAQLRQLCLVLAAVPQPTFFGWVAGVADLPFRPTTACNLLLSFMSFSHPNIFTGTL